MKSYKLIKTYPGSPKVGTVLAPKVDKENPSTNNYYWEGQRFNPNDFCEFWEEIFEKDYEIVAMEIAEGTILEFKDGLCVKRSDEHSVGGTADLITILKEQYHKDSIHSVKRLSDGEVFTVGDCFDAGLGSRTIESIWLDSEGVLGFNHENGRISNARGTGVFHKAKKLQPVLFTTEDEYNVFDGHWVYRVNKDFTIDNAISNLACGIDNRRKYFMTYEKAKRYILLNKPAISINEFWEISSMCMSNSAVTRVLEELVKKRMK
jgi:hypothetical protein